MRFGIFSDVHANIEALSAVMRGFEDEDIDEYYCLGDVVGYGASPNECSDLVRETAKVTILGNHDAASAPAGVPVVASAASASLPSARILPSNWLR